MPMFQESEIYLFGKQPARKQTSQDAETLPSLYEGIEPETKEWLAGFEPVPAEEAPAVDELLDQVLQDQRIAQIGKSVQRGDGRRQTARISRLHLLPPP